MALYTLVKRKQSGELHLFESVINDDSKCEATSNLSVCSAMNINQKGEAVFTCLVEDDARKECAKVGRAVCGNCVKNLYATNYK